MSGTGRSTGVTSIATGCGMSGAGRSITGSGAAGSSIMIAAGGSAAGGGAGVRSRTVSMAACAASTTSSAVPQRGPGSERRVLEVMVLAGVDRKGLEAHQGHLEIARLAQPVHHGDHLAIADAAVGAQEDAGLAVTGGGRVQGGGPALRARPRPRPGAGTDRRAG